MPHAIRLRRRRRRILLVSLLILVAGAGVVLYRIIDWNKMYQRYPTAWLLRSGKLEARIELDRRYHAGLLTQVESRKMFDALAAVDPELHCLPNYPAGVRVPLVICVGFQPYISGRRALVVDRWRAVVDGETFDEKMSVDRLRLSTIYSGAVWVWLPGQRPGNHHISLALYVDLVDPRGTVLHTWELTASGDFVAEDRPASTFVRARDDAEMTSRVEGSLDVSDRGTQGDPILRVRDLPIPIIGTLFARPSGTGPYERMDRVFVYEHFPPRRALPVEAGAMYELGLSDLCEPGVVITNTISTSSCFETGTILYFRKLAAGREEFTHVDIRIVPQDWLKAEDLIQLGITEYYGATIERFKLPIAVIDKLIEAP